MIHFVTIIALITALMANLKKPVLRTQQMKHKFTYKKH